MRKFITCVLAMMVAACNSSSPAPDATQASQERAIESAQDVVHAFEEAGLKVANVVVVTEASDSNSLLGRPGQYTSKVFFYDTRHPKSAEGGDDGENTVEFFASPEDAKTRHDYIESVTKGVPMLLQYQELNGRMLARFDKALLPSEVDEYKKVLANLKTD